MTSRDSKGATRELTILVRYEMKRDGAGYRKGDVVLLVENDKGARYTITLRRDHQHSCDCPSRRRCYHMNAAVATENSRAAARVALVRAEMALAPHISERINHDTSRTSTAHARPGVCSTDRERGRAA